MAQVMLLQREMFVWVDESGCGKRIQFENMDMLYVVCVLSEYHRFISRGTRFNTIAAMSSIGLVALEIITESVNGDKFLTSFGLH